MKVETLKLLLSTLEEEFKDLILKPDNMSKSREHIGEWCSYTEVKRHFNIPRHYLYKWVKEGKVAAKKFDNGEQNATVRFRTADIEKVFEQLPDYKFETKTQLNPKEEGEQAK